MKEFNNWPWGRKAEFINNETQGLHYPLILGGLVYNGGTITFKMDRAGKIFEINGALAPLEKHF